MKSRRVLVVLLAGLFLMGLGALDLLFWHALPIGSGPAGPAVPRGPFLHMWTRRRVLLVGLGDSITDGFGARQGYSYFSRLVANPRVESEDMQGICLKAVIPNLYVTNLAVSGSTSVEHADTQIPRLPPVGRDVVGIIVITTGGNDLIHNYGRTPPRSQAMYGATLEQAKPWIAELGQRLDVVVGKLEKHFPGGCEIFLADIYDPTDGVGDIERTGFPPWKDGLKVLAAYNDVIHQCAEKHPHVHLVKLHDAFLGHGIHCTQIWSKHYDAQDPHYWYYTNVEDPNERGYDVIRRLFLIEMGRTLSELK